MKQNGKTILGIGSPIVDLVVDIQEETLLKIPGEKGGMELVDVEGFHELTKLIDHTAVKGPGGAAGNTTFALARLGNQCKFMGKIGVDENAAYYLDTFTTLGGDTSRFKKNETIPTGCCISFVTPDGERTMRTHLGAAMTFSADDFTIDDFKDVDHVYVESYLLFNPELVMAVMQTAKEAGCEISLDLGSFEYVRDSKAILQTILKDYVDIVFANEEESAAFCGENDIRKGMDTLTALCNIAVVKVGADGVWIGNGKESAHVPAIPIGKLLDTTGAGDYCAAGILNGYLNGEPLEKAAKMGAILGGHAVQHWGALLPETTWKAIREEIAAL